MPYWGKKYDQNIVTLSATTIYIALYELSELYKYMSRIKQLHLCKYILRIDEGLYK